MESLDKKVIKEQKTLCKLIEVEQSDYINLKKHMNVSYEIDKRRNKLKFLRNLKDALEKVGNERTNKLDQEQETNRR